MRWTCTRGHEGRRGRRGQAVMPVVVTLAIAAAGAGLVAPVLRSRQEDAAKARSMRNLQALARATRMYAMDWGGTFPGWQQNPDGKYAHNVWDEQIYPYVRDNEAYTNGRPRGIRSWADPQKRRVLSYGLNGYLISWPYSISGSVRTTMISYESGHEPPSLMNLATVRRPADTIMLAELATEAPVYTNYTDPPVSGFQEWNRAFVPNQVADGTVAWNRAMDHWSDISPRQFVENANPVAGSYAPATWNTTSGIARGLYGGGGNYAFVDGHVEFLPIGETLGLGKTWRTPFGVIFQVAPGAVAWQPDNPYNKWYPFRDLLEGRERGAGQRWPIGR